MANDAGTAYIDVLPDLKGFGSGLSRGIDPHIDRSAKHITSSLGGAFTGVAKIAGGLFAAKIGVDFFKGTIEEAEEARKTLAQTNAVIKSTGGVANVTAKDVDSLASSLSAKTGIDDEAIAAGENMLLTFTKVRNEMGKGNDIFNQGTKAALDMSVAMGTDMKSASLTVGKALNDPIAGMTALTRSGVQFTAQQKEQIKAMVAAGDQLGAQKIILKELETQFGGSAEAAASPMAKLKVAFGNLQEEVGKRLLPALGTAATFLAERLPSSLQAVERTIGPIVGKVTQGFGALKSAFSGEGVTSDGFVGVMEEIGVRVRAVVDSVVGWVRANWPEIKRIITETMETVRSVVSGVVDVIQTIWRNFGSQIMSVVKAAWEYVKSTVQGALDVIQGIVKVVTGIIHGDWGRAWDGIKQIVSGVWDMITARIQLGIDVAKAILSVAMEIISSAWTRAWNGIKDFFGEVWTGIKNIVAAGIRGVVDFFMAGVEAVLKGAAAMFGWVPGVGEKLREAARGFEKLRDDVNDALGGVEDLHVEISADASAFWAEYDRVRAAAQRSVAISAQAPGVDSSGVQKFALGLEMGPVRGRPGEAVPIIAHAGEWVVTDEQLAALKSGQSGGSTAPSPGGHGHDIYLDGQKVGEARGVANGVSKGQRRAAGAYR